MSNDIWKPLTHWRCHPNVKAGFTLKNKQYPQSFNLAKHALTNSALGQIQDVENNRDLLLARLQVNRPIIWLNQVHSNRCVLADTEHYGAKADALFCNKTDVISAVLTADCLPIFLADKLGKEVAIVHGGWKGLLNGVLENTLKAFNSDEVQAYLGPAIGKDAFEVGLDVKSKFLEKSSDFEKAFAPEHIDGKYMANIYDIARVILNSFGINDIQGGDYCTVNDHSLFSYRNSDVTGRMAHLIWLER